MCLLPDGEFLGIVSSNSFSASPSFSSASGTDDRSVRSFVLVPQTPPPGSVRFISCLLSRLGNLHSSLFKFADPSLSFFCSAVKQIL